MPIGSLRRVALVAALSAAALGFGPGAGPAVLAGGSASYRGTAEAEGLRVTASGPDTEFLDGGGPLARSIVDGSGNSQAFASLPSPGPLQVESSYPAQAEQTLIQPGYQLVARSEEQRSEGWAKTGEIVENSPEKGLEQAPVLATQARAISGHDPDSGLVRVTAIATVDTLGLGGEEGGVLRIGRVVATAAVERAPGSEPVRRSLFRAEGVSILDKAVGLNEKGFTAVGRDAPLPDDSPLAQALEQAGITVTYLSAVEHPDGVVSPGLVIRQEREIPGGPSVVFTYVLGRAAAYAQAS
ncbi:MAG: hypothetical protein ACRDY7_03965 [Acidimicrobiia bacterium]